MMFSHYHSHSQHHPFAHLSCNAHTHTHIHTHTRLTALCPGLPRWASTRKVKPIWILLKQETVSGSGISWAICKSAPRSWQITMPAPHHSVFYRPDALPVAQPTASKHWRMDGPAPPHVFLPLPVLRQNLWVGNGGKELLWFEHPSCHPAISIEAPKGTQNTTRVLIIGLDLAFLLPAPFYMAVKVPRSTKLTVRDYQMVVQSHGY